MTAKDKQPLITAKGKQPTKSACAEPCIMQDGINSAVLDPTDIYRYEHAIFRLGKLFKITSK